MELIRRCLEADVNNERALTYPNREPCRPPPGALTFAHDSRSLRPLNRFRAPNQGNDR